MIKRPTKYHYSGYYSQAKYPKSSVTAERKLIDGSMKNSNSVKRVIAIIEVTKRTLRASWKLPTMNKVYAIASMWAHFISCSNSSQPAHEPIIKKRITMVIIVLKLAFK